MNCLHFVFLPKCSLWPLELCILANACIILTTESTIPFVHKYKMFWIHTNWNKWTDTLKGVDMHPIQKKVRTSDIYEHREYYSYSTILMIVYMIQFTVRKWQKWLWQHYLNHDCLFLLMILTFLLSQGYQAPGWFHSSHDSWIVKYCVL